MIDQSNRQTPDTDSRDDDVDLSNKPASNYYYDDATGYEVYDSENEANDDDREEQSIHTQT